MLSQQSAFHQLPLYRLHLPTFINSIIAAALPRTAAAEVLFFTVPRFLLCAPTVMDLLDMLVKFMLGTLVKDMLGTLGILKTRVSAMRKLVVDSEAKSFMEELVSFAFFACQGIID